MYIYIYTQCIYIYTVYIYMYIYIYVLNQHADSFQHNKHWACGNQCGDVVQSIQTKYTAYQWNVRDSLVPWTCCCCDDRSPIPPDPITSKDGPIRCEGEMYELQEGCWRLLRLEPWKSWGYERNGIIGIPSQFQECQRFAHFNFGDT